MNKKKNPSLRGGKANVAIQKAGSPRSARDDDKRDIFNTKWVIFGVIVASLLIPLLGGCGVKGDLKHPKETTRR